MGNASTRNAYSSSQQKVSSHSNGISKIEGLIVSTPEPKVKQKRIREPDCHKKGGWVAIGTFVVTHPSEKVPILCNTRYIFSCFRIHVPSTVLLVSLGCVQSPVLRLGLVVFSKCFRSYASYSPLLVPPRRSALQTLFLVFSTNLEVCDRAL